MQSGVAGFSPAFCSQGHMYQAPPQSFILSISDHTEAGGVTNGFDARSARGISPESRADGAQHSLSPVTIHRTARDEARAPSLVRVAQTHGCSVGGRPSSAAPEQASSPRHLALNRSFFVASPSSVAAPLRNNVASYMLLTSCTGRGGLGVDQDIGATRSSRHALEDVSS